MVQVLVPSCHVFAMSCGFERPNMLLHRCWQGVAVWVDSQEGAFKWAAFRCRRAMVWCKAHRCRFCCGTGAEPCPGAEQVLAVRKSGRFAWVEFSTIQAAHQALALDGEPLGTGMLKISQSKTPIHTAGWRAPVRLLCFVHCPFAACLVVCHVCQALQAGRAHYLQSWERTRLGNDAWQSGC